MIFSSCSVSSLSDSQHNWRFSLDNTNEVETSEDLPSLSSSKLLKFETPVTKGVSESALASELEFPRPPPDHFFSDELLPEIPWSQLVLEPPEVRRVVFEERLVLEDDQGVWLDEVTLAVEAVEDELLVYQYSRDEGRLLRVSSRVDRGLDTTTELRRISGADHTRTLRVTAAPGGYSVFALSVSGTDGWRDKVEYPKAPSSLVVLEGANIVLLRKLAASGLRGQFQGQTISHEGELCEVRYHAVQGEGGDTVVRRVVSSAAGSEVMTTVLSARGRIRSHWWSGSTWRLVGTDPVARPGSRGSSPGEAEEHEPSEEEEEEEEVDTVAYFEKKSDLIVLMKKYILDQPDVQDMIADFLKNLLFEKPDDVVGFADRFFSEFMGIDWFLEDSESPLSCNNFSADESSQTCGFGAKFSDLGERSKTSNIRSLESSIRSDILNKIINRL